MTIYEIEERYRMLYEFMEDPDMDEETIRDTMESIDAVLEEKADGYAKVMTQLKADADAIEVEIKRLQRRKETLLENSIRLKNTLQEAMILAEKPKFKTELFSFSIRKSPAAVVLDTGDLEKIPREYLVYQDPKINKKKLRDDLKAGVDLQGIAHLTQGESLIIK